MAETIISPGVFTRENDISFIQPAPVAAGAAIIGPTAKGPVEIPTLVTSYGDYVRKFGTTFASGSNSYEFLTSIAVKNYFQQGGNSVLVSRVITGSFDPARSTRISNTTTTTGDATATGNKVLTVAPVAGQEFQVVDASTNITYNFTGITNGAVLPDQDVENFNFFFDVGTDVESFIDNLGAVVNSAPVSAVIPFDVDLGAAATTLKIDASAAGTPGNSLTISSGSAAGGDPVSGNIFTLAGGTDTTTATADSFILHTLGKGEIYNNAIDATTIQENSDSSLVTGSSDNIRWEISNVNSDLGTFSLSVRQGDDSLKNKIVLETFNDLSLDPNSPNYIESVIGNQHKLLSTDGDGSKYIATHKEYVNKSNYIRVAAVNTPTLDYLSTDGVTVNTDAQGVSYASSLPIAQSGSFYDAAGALYASDRQAKFFGEIDSIDTQGLTPGCYSDVISVLENSDDYIFNIISAPGLAYRLTGHSTEIDSIISLAETRGDCISVIDLVDYLVTGESTVTGQAALLNSSYAASYWPWLQTQAATGKNEWVPASVVIPGVYAFTDNSSAPWFAPAGLVRGGITGVIQAQKRLTRTQRDTLYSKKVNPIASFPGQGISVFGQKTLQTKASALDRVNVRRLLIELKKFIGDQARNLVFEQNTIATRNRFLATVNPYLESVVQRQGLYSYRVVMDDSNNTADVVDRNQLIGQIFIQPAKTAEFIVLDFTIEPTGATFVG